MDDVKSIALQKLREHFGFENFRTNQLEAITSTISQRDCLLILPTGGGKSLTFQIPPLITKKITIVVTPLLALLKDQVDSLLNTHDIEAASWSSQSSEQTKINIAKELLSNRPDLRLIYSTPESFQTPRFMGLLVEAHGMGNLCSIAIDEAHVIVEWGMDFRPSYLNLGEIIRGKLPSLPIIAVTASATSQVRSAICTSLHLQDPLIILSTFNRPEIRFNVVYKETIGSGSSTDVLEHIKSFIQDESERDETSGGIVYCRLRSTCDEVATFLCNAEIDAAAYHAGMDPARRARVQQEWTSGAIATVVSTIAFGMGIDRGNVRWVVHMDPPSTLEGLYQEAGRGGRDGLPATHVVYTSVADLQLAAKLEKGQRGAAAVAGYLMQCQCRRKALLDHFGEKRAVCNAAAEEPCDVCRDAGVAVRRALEEVERMNSAARDAQGKRESVVHDDYDWCDDVGKENYGSSTEVEGKKVRKESKNGHGIAAATMLPRPVKIQRYTSSAATVRAVTGTATKSEILLETNGTAPQRNRFKPPRMV